MEIAKPSTFLIFASLLIFFSSTLSQEVRDGLQTFIVHVEHPSSSILAASYPNLESWHASFLPESDRIVHSYKNAISGFAARLTQAEARAMANKEGLLSVLPDHQLLLTTTHTPSFLGLQVGSGIWNYSRLGHGVIIGMVDSGVTPGHPSFNDDGMPAPPSKWKGACQLPGSPCNNKLIGARNLAHSAAISMRSGLSSDATDVDGHGTHTASTAAGSFVNNANALGQANGTAAGMAPRAHLAVYKVCSAASCFAADILAGIDAAIEDGVDVISISIANGSMPFYNDVMAIGAYAAVSKGIFVSCAAGNNGPVEHSLSNEAPWILTVGASTIDRSIVATVKLGDGQEFDGQTLFQPANFTSSMLPLVTVQFCQKEILDPVDVRGKIVLCTVVDGPRILNQLIKQSALAKDAGAAAVILMNPRERGYTTEAQAHQIAASHVSYADGSKIRTYANLTEKPIAAITFKGTIVGATLAPTMAFFSSRGPNSASPNIMKPDITGPGVNILAAWPFQVGPPSAASPGNVTFDVVSGTSMSAPHLSGIAALIKSVHPDWSPAAIKSAIMTTSDVLDHEGKPIVDEQLQPAGFFAIGAGHVNPSKAINPGLVYDIGADDYVPYLCGLGYTDTEIGSIVRHKVSCSGLNNISEYELNYPSMMVTLNSGTVEVNRTVTNVGDVNSTYSVEIQQPAEGVYVSVTPVKLQFAEANEKKSFTVSFKRVSSNGDEAKFLQGSLKWIYGERVVRSPIIVALGP